MAVQWYRPTREPVHPKNWNRWAAPKEQWDDLRVTQEWDDIDLYWLSQGIVQIHNATDIGDGKCGSELLAMRDSRIFHVEDETPPEKGGPALGTRGDCGDGWDYEFWHVDERLVPNGALVKAGTPIATIGATGLNIGGCHCHIKVHHKGVDVNSTPIILGAADSLEVPMAVFDDVKPSNKFYNDIKWLKDNGITHGVAGTNNFAPKGLVNREQMAAFLRRTYSKALRDAIAALRD